MQNISINTEATVKNAEGIEINAQQLICENKPLILLSLEAIKASIKNPIVKGLIAIVVNLVEHIVENYCSKV